MQAPNSPLFPALQLTIGPSAGIDSLVADEQLIPQLPDEPLTQTSSLQVYVIPAEKHLYVQGFDARDYAERPPALLRGCLYLRVLKPTKIKSITLSFKGQLRTDWPEGIPPKKNVYIDVSDVVSHTWPFYQMENASANGGADIFVPAPGKHDQEITHLSLTETKSRTQSPMGVSQPSNISLNHLGGGLGNNFFSRNLSPSASFIRRSASPANEHMDITTSMSAPDIDTSKPGHFPVGDYIYDFEHALHPSVPESTNVTFGSVQYHLEAEIIRVGAFKLNLTARLPIDVVRTPSELNSEENEPIVITRDWEDQLRYDIVVGGKSIVLNSYLPLALRFVPLWGKVALHRIRVYLTENLEYYCQNKKVHRMEPSKKFLLLEHKACKGKSLLSKSGGLTENPAEAEDEEVLPRELEFQLYVPKVLDEKMGLQLHPDTSFENIQAHHWIKICLRISKLNPDNPEKRKHYEISIDSPIHVLSPLAARGNTLLPAYDNQIEQFLPEYTPSSPPLSPGVTPIECSLIGGVLGGSQTTGSSFGQVMGGMGSSFGQVMSAAGSRASSRSQSPHQFHHLNSTSNNDDPIERDADMHLGANLYEPEPNQENTPLNSPQALPHPDTFHSPLLQALLSSPPLDPPPFIEGSTDGKTEALPPAYEVRDPALSLSPLRIDDGPTPTLKLESTLGSIPSLEINKNIIVTPPTPFQETPIKDLLSQQLNQMASPKPKDIERNASKSPQRQSFDEEDIVDSSSAPIQPPSPMQQPRHLPSPRRQSVTSQSRRSSMFSLGSEAYDEMPVEQTLPLLNSSTASLGEAFVDKTSRSNSTTGRDSHEVDRRPSNLQGFPTRIYDMVDGDLSEKPNKFSGNLLQLRNPRIKKHYQVDTYNIEAEKETQKAKENGKKEDEEKKKDESEKTESEKKEEDDQRPASKCQPSADGSEHSDRSSSSVESDVTVEESGGVRKSHESHIPPARDSIPGFKYGYVID